MLETNRGDLKSNKLHLYRLVGELDQVETKAKLVERLLNLLQELLLKEKFVFQTSMLKQSLVRI